MSHSILGLKSEKNRIILAQSELKSKYRTRDYINTELIKKEETEYLDN